MSVGAEPAVIPGAFSGTDKRAGFPVFERLTGTGQRLVYLDAAASAPKPQVVIDAMADAYAHHYANVHRGIYELSEDATQRFEAARRKVAAFLGAPSEREIVFVRNATEAINLVAYSWGRSNLAAGDVMVTTQLEHHANIVPWQQLTREVGAELRYVLITDDGLLDLDDLDRHLAAKPKLVAVSAVSNALGTINPIVEITRRAHAAGALVLIDAAQAAPHMPIDIGAIGCDFLVVSGHKMLGPSGIGALWARRELLEAMPPFMTGGNMILRVTLEGAEWNTVPQKFEAGTPAIVEAIGALDRPIPVLSCFMSARGVPDQLAIGPLRFDFRALTATGAHGPAELSSHDILVMRVLAERRGEVVARIEIVEEVCGLDSEATLRTVDNHVMALRRALGEDPRRPRWLHTVRGEGYRLARPDEG